MKKLILILMMILLWVFFQESALFPCSTFVAGKGERLLFGRNYDFFTGTGFVVANPRGLKKSALVYPGEIPAVWTARYGSLTFNQAGREYPTGGMNEAGLVVECMWLSHTQYPMPDPRPAVMDLQWMQYLLDTCGTVDEVLASDAKIRVQQKGQPLHFLICDRQGNVAVVEFINFRTYAYRIKRSDVRALTNSSYADCTQYLKRFKGFGGREEIQQTIFSVDRFVRLAAAIRDKKPTVAKAFGWLDMVAAKPGEAKNAHTQWQIVYVPGSREIHFRTHAHPEILTLSMSDFSFDCGGGARVLDLKGLPDDSAADHFIPFTTEINGKFVRRTFAVYKEHKFATDIPDLYLTVLGNYPASLKCAGE